MQDDGWDPTLLCAPNGHLVPPPLFLDDSIPFAEGGYLIIDIPPCRFGACLKRLMNWNVAARKKFPGRKILSSKIDYKLAYRRCRLNTDTAIQTCTQLPEKDLAIVVLWLTFGGVPGPYEWGVISYSICDLSIAIMQDAGWDPTSLCATNGHLVPPPLFLKDSIPFAEWKDLIIDVSVDARGTVDV